ncbi:tetratricopeptide repeat protein, partial [Pseudomonas tremae]|uniref:tetratricopeptide repeat protein n=1 Tax=Pseudomonas tremae TaxID=200454 RepID=UPI00210915F4
AYVLLGRLNLADGDSKNAVVRAKKALEFNPYYAAAYLLMGDAQLADGTYKEAASTLRKAVELYPGWMEAHRSYLESLRKQALIEEIKREEAQIAELEQKNN